MRVSLTAADAKEIKDRRAANERAMEAEIEGVCAARRHCRQSVGDTTLDGTLGVGKRLAQAKLQYRKQVVWGRPSKMKFGALE